jgi:glycosyltransferase involved in cell wall biosynthesis
MRISIAMCTYNGQQFLQRQLDSFAAQTSPPQELVVCDDGSTDDTLAIVDRFAERVKFPVRIYKNSQNLGAAKNFEQAISLCSGDLIALSDQDDQWYPGKLAEFQHFFEKFPEAVVAFSDADLIDEHSVPLQKKLWRSVRFVHSNPTPHVEASIFAVLLKLNNVATGATMVIRSQFRSQFIPIPPSWLHDAWIIWVAAFYGHAGLVPGAQICYRIHPKQQVGLDPASITARLAHSRQNAIKDYRLLTRQLEEFKDYLQRKDDPAANECIYRVNAKIRLIEARATLPISILPRIRWILSSWREYHYYTRGFITMMKDILLPPMNASSNQAENQDSKELR